MRTIGKRIRFLGALPAEYRGCSTRVESLCDSNGLTAFVFCDIASIHLMRLPLLENKVRKILDKISRRRKETHQTFLYPHRIIEVVQPLLLKICLLSTALLRKNKCSTYSKYVSALFLFAPCIQYHYFQKANGKVIAKATTSILRNLIYSSDAFSLLL